MATLFVTEWEGIRYDGNIQVPYGWLATNNVTIGGSSTQSSTFNARTKLIEVSPDAICSIKIAANPTATAANMRLPADASRFYGVRGSTDKIAAITNS